MEPDRRLNIHKFKSNYLVGDGEDVRGLFGCEGLGWRYLNLIALPQLAVLVETPSFRYHFTKCY
jgi:hypothetical protein